MVNPCDQKLIGRHGDKRVLLNMTELRAGRKPGTLDEETGKALGEEVKKLRRNGIHTLSELRDPWAT